MVGTADDRSGNRRVVGLSAGTGEQLWERKEHWSITVDGVEPSRPWFLTRGDAAAGIVVVQPESPSERVGIDVRTGEERWRVDLADGCAGTADRAGAGSDDLVLVRLSCDQGDAVYVALDATSGAPRWHHPSSDELSPTMRDGITMWGFGTRPPMLLGSDGQALFTGPDGTVALCTADCGPVVADGHALMTARFEGSHDRVSFSVDLSTGASRTLPTVPGQMFSQNAAVTVGGRVYEVTPMAYPDHSHGTALLPAMLRVTDPTSQRIDYAALPFPAPMTPDRTVVGWFGVAGDRIFTATQPSADGNNPSGPPVLTAYTVRDTTAPTELGGVSPASWPDPCALLAGMPDEYQLSRGGPLTIGGTTIPATTCSIQVPGRGTNTVTVDWVAATEQEADALFEDGDPPTYDADEEDEMSTEFWRLRVGRTVVSLHIDVGETADFAPVVVRNLRRTG